MKRLLSLSVVIYALVILGLSTLHGRIMILALPLILYLAAAFLHRPGEVYLTASRSFSADRVPQEMPVLVKLSITNEGAPLENVLLEDLVPRGLEVIDGNWRTLVALESGETVTLEYTLRGQRGFYRFRGLRATASEHLGLFNRQVGLPLPGQVFVLPRVHKLPQVAIRPQRTRVFAGSIPARKGGPGVDFYGVREYQPGDPLRWINQRVSARHEQAIFVNEFEQERAADVGLILDTRRAANLYADQSSLLEYSIEATATLADAFLKRGNRVGLFIYGGFIDWTFPGYGKVQRERILQALSRARLQESQVFENLYYLPTRLFPIRSQLVLVSPLRGADLEDLAALRARGYQLLIISPDPIAFEAGVLRKSQDLVLRKSQDLVLRKSQDLVLRKSQDLVLGESQDVALAVRIARLEREHLFCRLRQVGVRIFQWQVDTPFHHSARYALSRAPLWSHDPRGRR